MKELRDDDILEVKDPDTLSDDDIIEVSEPGFLDRAMAAYENPESSISGNIQKVIGQEIPVIDKAEDTFRGVAKGFSFAGIDELGGAAMTAVERGLGAVGIGPAAVDAKLRRERTTGSGVEESLADTYKGYQDAINKSLQESEERSPWLFKGGELAGNIASSVALGGALGLGKNAGKVKSIIDIAKDSGKARAALELLKRGGANYAKAAPALAVESALTSEADLVGKNARPLEVAKDVAGGLSFAGLVMGGGQLISDVAAPLAKARLDKVSDKISEIASESPLARQIKIAYDKYGKTAKVNPLSEEARKTGVTMLHGGTPLNILPEKQASDMVDKVLDSDKQFARLVGDTLEEAEKRNVLIDSNSVLSDATKKIDDLKLQFPELIDSKSFNSIVDGVKSRIARSSTPSQVKATMQDITSQINRIKGYKNPTTEQEQALEILQFLRGGVDETLKKTIPEYARAANRLFSFRRSFIEQPIGGSYNPELHETWYSNLKKGDLKLTKSYEDLVRNSQDTSQGAVSSASRYSNFKKAAEEFEANELALMQTGQVPVKRIAPSVKDLFKNIDNYADENMMLDSVKRTQESQSAGSLLKKSLFLGAETGRGGVYQSAYMTGRVASSKPARYLADLGRTIYNAPAEQLQGLATKLENNVATASYGRALRAGLENGDKAKQNAALFTIMQNPKARALIEAEAANDETIEEQET